MATSGVSVAADIPQPSPEPVVPDLADLGWERVFDEDFEDPELDESVWRVHEGPGTTGAGMYTRDAVGIQEGNLTLTTYTEGGEHYTGEVRAGDRGDWLGQTNTYGYIEARVRLNNAPGTRSAFWMLSPTWHQSPFQDPAAAGPEIDMFEIRNPEAGDVEPEDGHCDYQPLPLPCDEIAAGGMHWSGFDESYNHFNRRVEWDGPSPQGNYITYGLLWTPDGYRMYRDGREVVRGTEAITYSPEYLIFSQHNWQNRAPDGGYGSLEESDTRMEIDHVRVWQRPISAVPDQTLAAGGSAAVPFHVTDHFFTNPDHDHPESVRVTASSSNHSVMRDQDLVVTGNGAAEPLGTFANGSFDTDERWTFPTFSDGSTNTAHLSDEGRSLSAPRALRLEYEGGRAEQAITGLEPGTTYTLGTRYNIGLEWDDTDGSGTIDEGETFLDSTRAVGSFDLGAIDTATGSELARSTHERNGWRERGRWWSPHEDDWQSAVTTFTTPPSSTEVTVFIDNTSGTRADMSFDDVWFQPLVPPDRSLALQAGPGAAGEATITLTALDQADQVLGTHELEVTVADSSFTNGGFEARPTDAGWDMTGARTVLEDPFEQNHMVELAREGPGTVVQDVTGLEPNTEHVLELRGRVDTEGGTVGAVVGEYGGPQVSTEIQTTSWSDATTAFTTDDSGNARIYLLDWDVDDGASMVDDVLVRPADGLGSGTVAPGPSFPALADLTEVHLTSGTPRAVQYAASGSTTVHAIESSNPRLLPDRNVAVTDGAGEGVLSLTPVRGRAGRASVRLYTSEDRASWHDVVVAVSASELENPGFERGARGWDLSGGGQVSGDGLQRTGDGALVLRPGDEATQLIDELNFDRELVLRAWSRGDLEVTARTVPDASMTPPESYEETFATTWADTGEWSDNTLQFRTVQCSTCLTTGSTIEDRTDQDPDSVATAPGGQVEVTFRAVGTEPAVVEDLGLSRPPAISRIRNISLHQDQQDFAWNTRRRFSVGHAPANGWHDPEVVEVSSSDENVLPLDNIWVTRSDRVSDVSPFAWQVQVRAGSGAAQPTGRSEVTLAVTDPDTGLRAEETFMVTINAGTSFNNGDFQRGVSWEACTDEVAEDWCNASWLFPTSYDVNERQSWRYLGPTNEDRVLRLSSGVAGHRITGLEPETEYVVRSNGFGNGAHPDEADNEAALQVMSTDGMWGDVPVPIFGTERGRSVIDSPGWGPVPDLRFTTAPGETEVYLFARVDCVHEEPEDEDSPCRTIAASRRYCALLAPGEVCLDDIGVFRAQDVD